MSRCRLSGTLPRFPLRRRSAWWTILALALFTVFPGRAGAQLNVIGSEGKASASVEFFGTGPPSRSVEQTFGPFGGAAVAQIGRVRAAQTGSGINAVTAEGRLGDIPSFQFSAATDIDVTVRNDGRSAAPAIFHYTINGGELRLFDPSNSFDNYRASVGIVIFTIGTSGQSGFLSWWTLTLRGGGGSATAAFDVFADPLNLGTPAISPVTVAGGEARVSIAPFTATADLGTIGRGGTATFTYAMSADVTARGLNNQGGKATLGDPFDLSGNPGSVIAIEGVDLAAVVPELSAPWLLVIGLPMLLWRRMAIRRRDGISGGSLLTAP